MQPLSSLQTVLNCKVLKITIFTSWGILLSVHFLMLFVELESEPSDSSAKVLWTLLLPGNNSNIWLYAVSQFIILLTFLTNVQQHSCSISGKQQPNCFQRSKWIHRIPGPASSWSSVKAANFARLLWGSCVNFEVVFWLVVHRCQSFTCHWSHCTSCWFLPSTSSVVYLESLQNWSGQQTLSVGINHASVELQNRLWSSSLTTVHWQDFKAQPTAFASGKWWSCCLTWHTRTCARRRSLCYT